MRNHAMTNRSELSRKLITPLILAVGLCSAPLAGHAAVVTGPLQLSFSSHAAAFARESNAQVAIDPHVFVPDANAPDTTGPEGIHHIAGIRPARLADSPDLALQNAQGDPLGLSLAKWLATRGTVDVQNDQHSLSLRFTHLIPFGVYSLYSNRAASNGAMLTPVKTEDGVSTFNAPGDGLLQLSIPMQHELSSHEAIVLIYHSDDTDHQDQPGTFGVDAHVQLVLIPTGLGSTPIVPVPSYAQPQSDPSDGEPSLPENAPL